MDNNITIDHARAALYAQLRQAIEASQDTATAADPAACHGTIDAIEAIQARLRQHIPAADTGGGLPQAKTPQGRTRYLHMNYGRNAAGDPVATDGEHLHFFARTATQLGLGLSVLTSAAGRLDVETALNHSNYVGLNYRIATAQGAVSKWAEDSVECLTHGAIAVPPAIDTAILAWAMTNGRRQRWQEVVSPSILAAALQDDHLWIPLGVEVSRSTMIQEWETLAHAQGSAIGHLRAYIEGGNLITGEDATGKPMVLVGKDAIATTAHLYQLPESAIKQFICDDFGLQTVEQVIAVEQPGQFHLDMGMLFLGQGVVVVNDSHVDGQNAKEMAELAPCETTQMMADKLQLQGALETAASNDLSRAGLRVIREPLAQSVLYNFCNGEFVQGQDGQPYYITNGAAPNQQARFEALMVQDWQVVKQVFFSPAAAAHKSLSDRGGVGCRLKGCGRLLV